LIKDVGEYIPYAKKDSSTKAIHADRLDKTPPVAISLKNLWPEPDWIASYIDGIPVDVLAAIYSIYHSLAKKPHPKKNLHFRATVQMWESAYIETVEYIRLACENATTSGCIRELEKTFNQHFNVKGKVTYKTYAAGSKTHKTFFHPLGRSGVYAEYEKLLPLLGWPIEINAKKIPLIPIEMVHCDTNKVYYLLGKRNRKSVSWMNSCKDYENKFETYDSAVSTLIKYHGSEFIIVESDRKNSDLYTPKKDYSTMPGVGDDFISMTPEELMKHYGFRGIQFGNYLPQKERQSYVNNAFYSLNLLSNILNIPAYWIGGGKLGLAFGARGHGFASAHYELELHVINLTRFNGPGCIAHECWHSIEARMAEKWIGKAGLLSNLIVKGGVKVQDIPIKFRKRFQAYRDIVEACTTSSEFTRNASKIESQKGAAKYWSEPAELCARAFEAYIQDILEDKNIYGQWLACGTRETDHKAKGMHPYPTGDDRERINAIFATNIPIVFSRETTPWFVKYLT